MRSLVFAAIMLITTSAHAAEFFILPGTKTLLVMGETRLADVETLSSNIEDNGIDALILKGPGGSLEAGYAMADIVLKHELSITIPEGTDCASACSLIFASGSDRVMEKGSRLGFHLPFVQLTNFEMSQYCHALKAKAKANISPFLYAKVDPECLMLTYQQGLKDIRRLSKILSRDNISEKVVDLLMNTPSNEMAWISPIEAVGYGLAHKLDD